jgi:predicted transcriptional regulator
MVDGTALSPDADLLGKMRSEIELLARHIEVVKAVGTHQPIGILKLSELLDQPVHRVRYSLHVLEALGYISASSAGAVATPRTAGLLEGLDREIDGLIALLQSIRRQ